MRLSHARTLALVLLVLLVLLASLGAAAEVRLTPEDVAALSTLADLRLSPDGEHLVYALTTHELDPEAKPVEDDTKAGWKNDRQLWLLATARGTPRQLTHGEERAGTPRWSPDGHELAFLRKLDDKTTIHVLRLDGGDAEPIPTGELEPTSLGWSADGRWLAFTAAAPLTKEEKDAKWKTGGTIEWDAEWRSEQLYVVPRAGGEPRQVTPGPEHVVAWDWSPDGRRFVVLCSKSADPYEASNLLLPRIVAAADGSVLRTLDDEPRACDHPRWSPDGRWIAYGTTQESLSMGNVLQVCDAATGERWNAAQGIDRTLATFEWAPDSRSLLALVRERTKCTLIRFPVRGGAAADLGFAGRIIDGDLQVSRDGRTLACVSSTDRETGDPTLFDIAGRGVRVVARLNPQLGGWALGTQEIVRWKSPEGPELEGLLALPPGARPGSPAPLLVMPHGGPDDVTQARFSAMTQFFAAHGYSVFRPNYRGGIGYGHAFYAANRGRLGAIEFMDIESGVDALVSAGKADPKQLFYGGWSWGGYLTAWTIGHTTRYRAAVVGAGVNDVVTSYALSDINHGVASQWEFEGDPWRQPENFDRANPIRSIRNAVTPTLVLHGQSDDRVPFQQGIILYRALRDVGCPVQFYAYPREPHGLNEPAHVAHRLRVWLDWLDRHREGAPAGGR